MLKRSHFFRIIFIILCLGIAHAPLFPSNKEEAKKEIINPLIGVAFISNPWRFELGFIFINNNYLYVFVRQNDALVYNSDAKIFKTLYSYSMTETNDSIFINIVETEPAVLSTDVKNKTRCDSSMLIKDGNNGRFKRVPNMQDYGLLLRAYNPITLEYSKKNQSLFLRHKIRISIREQDTAPSVGAPGFSPPAYYTADDDDKEGLNRSKIVKIYGDSVVFPQWLSLDVSEDQSIYFCKQ